jgi:mandelamide amidase
MNVFAHKIDQDHGKLGKGSPGHDMTFAVKANIGCGHPWRTSSSTPSLRNWVSKNRSPVVQRLLDGGYQIVGMVNMHELAFGITSENSGEFREATVDNPRKAGYIPGGSSGGSGAAVAINAVPFALGTDTGGSVRIPAALCGVVGYRPTIKLYDASVVCPLSSTTDTIGILARQMEIIQQVHKVIVPSYSPVVRQLSGVRMGVPRRYFYSPLDDEVSRVTEAALQLLKNGGVELVEVDFPAELSDDLLGAYFDLISYETYRLIPKFLQDQEAPVSFEQLCKQISDPVVKDIITNAEKISEERYSQCQQVVEKVRKLYDDYFKTNTLDVFVAPTTILPAVKRPSPMNVQVADQTLPTIIAYTHNTFPQAIAGVPSISLPSGMTSDGLPVGLEVVGPRGLDSSVLDIAMSMQEVLPPMPQLSFDDFKDKI